MNPLNESVLRVSIGPNIKLAGEVIYKANDLLVINKVPGIHTDEIEAQCAESGVLYKAAHRLDRETSGALLLVKPELEEGFSKLFRKAGDVEKIYWAGTSQAYDWVGDANPSYTFEGYLGSRYRSSKRCHVSFEKSFRGFHSERKISHIIRKFSDFNLSEFQSVFTGLPIEVQLISGGRHQIRAYFEFKKCPIVGDPIYNPSSKAKRMELHCRSLKLIDPRDQKNLFFEAPLRG